MTQHRVDLAIIGTGSGNSLLTDYWEGKQVAIAEKSVFGGTCLNVGCIPTKSLLRNAEIVHIVTKEADKFGLTGEMSADYGKAFSRSRQVSDRMVNGITS